MESSSSSVPQASSSYSTSTDYHAFGDGQQTQGMQVSTSESYQDYGHVSDPAGGDTSVSSSFSPLVNFSSADSTYTPSFVAVDYRPLHWGDANHHQSFLQAETNVKQEAESTGDSAVSSMTSSGRVSSTSDVSPDLFTCFLSTPAVYCIFSVL